MYRFLPRPTLPDMPLHVLDWGRMPPPSQTLSVRLGLRERERLGALLVSLLQPMDSLDSIEADAAARLDDGDWSPDHHAPLFAPRRGRHPDVGWSLTRLVTPSRWERWAAEDDLDEWYVSEDELDESTGMESRPGSILVYHWGSTIEIFADAIVGEGDEDEGSALLQAMQGVTGLACYSDADHLVLDPVICAVCKTFFLLWECDGEHQGCPRCGSEWVHVLP